MEFRKRSNQEQGVVNKTVRLNRKLWLALEIIWRIDGRVGIGDWFNALVANLVMTRLRHPDWPKTLETWLEDNKREARWLVSQANDMKDWQGEWDKLLAPNSREAIAKDNAALERELGL